MGLNVGAAARLSDSVASLYRCRTVATSVSMPAQSRDVWRILYGLGAICGRGNWGAGFIFHPRVPIEGACGASGREMAISPAKQAMPHLFDLCRRGWDCCAIVQLNRQRVLEALGPFRALRGAPQNSASTGQRADLPRTAAERYRLGLTCDWNKVLVYA